MDSSVAKNRLRVISLVGLIIFFGALFAPWSSEEVLRVGADTSERVVLGVSGWSINAGGLPAWSALIPAFCVALLSFCSAGVWRAVTATILNGMMIAMILMLNSWAWGAVVAIFTASLVQLAWTVELRRAGQAADTNEQS